MAKTRPLLSHEIIEVDNKANLLERGSLILYAFFDHCMSLSKMCANTAQVLQIWDVNDVI